MGEPGGCSPASEEKTWAALRAELGDGDVDDASAVTSVWLWGRLAVAVVAGKKKSREGNT